MPRFPQRYSAVFRFVIYQTYTEIDNGKASKCRRASSPRFGLCKKWNFVTSLCHRLAPCRNYFKNAPNFEFSSNQVDFQILQKSCIFTRVCDFFYFIFIFQSYSDEIFIRFKSRTNAFPQQNLTSTAPRPKSKIEHYLFTGTLVLKLVKALYIYKTEKRLVLGWKGMLLEEDILMIYLIFEITITGRTRSCRIYNYKHKKMNNKTFFNQKNSQL